jgi:hypothetical protein
MSTIDKAVRSVCLHFPEAVEVESRGSPNFRVRNKTFAMYVVNHHGDGRISLWLNASPETQSMYVDSEPEFFFVPPYVGVRGWVGLPLNHDMPC